jgi:SsrA-binding protein
MATLVANKKAHLSWEIEQKLDAGIELLGFEVKSLKNGQGSLEGASVGVRGGEAFLIGATVSPYQVGNTPTDYDPMRPRRLLLHKFEIDALLGAESTKGHSLIPLSFYTKNNQIKLEIGIGRHKKKHDKRADISKRETNRDIQREMKRG